MNIIKRNGSESTFSKNKIIKALMKANDSMNEMDRIPSSQLKKIADTVEQRIVSLNTTVNIEVIQNFIEEELMSGSKSPICEGAKGFFRIGGLMNWRSW